MRGAKTKIVEFFLSILIILSVISSFFINKWWVGVIAVVSVFILVGFFKPIAKVLAYKILGYRTGTDDELIMSGELLGSLKKDGDFERIMLKIEKEEKKNTNRLQKIYYKPRIRNILNANQVTFDDFYKLSQKLSLTLNDIKWEILNSSVDLEDLISFGFNSPLLAAFFYIFVYERKRIHTQIAQCFGTAVSFCLSGEV